MEQADRRTRLTSPWRAKRVVVFTIGMLLVACAKEEHDGDAGGEPAAPSTDGDAGETRPNYDLEGCVVSVLATDCSGGLPAPHEVELLNAKTGEPLPGLRTTSAPGGKYAIKNVPGDIEVAVHAIGVGPVTEAGSTYDTVAFHAPRSGDNLLRVSSVGTAGYTGMVAAFTPAADKAALSGAVYQVADDGRRIGAVGCAQVYVDDAPHPAASLDQRYNASNGIPTTLSKLSQTLAGSGRFYFGNLSKGEHTFKVSLDGGKSFIVSRTVFVGRAREDAASPFKSVLYLLALDVAGPNPTPAGCPSEEKM